MIKSCVALAVFLCSATPAVTHGQVFLASRPHPDFLVGPLFVVANVSPGLGPATVNLSWSLTRPTRRPVDIQQDLYLLWPAEVAATTPPGPAEPARLRGLQSRGRSAATAGGATLMR